MTNSFNAVKIMAVRVLGCSGSIAAGSFSTSFLLDEQVLIDAGTGVGEMTLDELLAVDHVFISHSHLDHVLSIGLLADTVQRHRRVKGRPPIQIRALARTIDALRRHLFNGVIWPDFSELPDRTNPTISFMPFEVGDRIAVCGRCIEVLPARHTVPAVGFAVFGSPHGSGPAWVFSGDTGPNPALWQRLSQLQVGTLVMETAFRNDEHELAVISRHLNPVQLMDELEHLPGSIDVYITHIKPGEAETVMSEIAACPTRHRIHGLSSGQIMAIQD